MKNTRDTYPESVREKCKSADDGVMLDRTRSRLAEGITLGRDGADRRNFAWVVDLAHAF